MTVFFNPNVNHLASRAQSKTHVEHVKPSYTAPFDVMTLDILTQETVFLEVGGLRYLKRFLQALPCRYCSLIRYFTALSLFSLVCRLRAWHSLGKRERSKQERRHRDYAGLLQLFFTLLLIGLTQVACFSKSQYTLTASLLHPSFGSIVYSPMIIKRDYPL